jgi:hypothetical protein
LKHSRDATQPNAVVLAKVRRSDAVNFALCEPGQQREAGIRIWAPWRSKFSARYVDECGPDRIAKFANRHAVSDEDPNQGVQKVTAGGK